MADTSAGSHAHANSISDANANANAMSRRESATSADLTQQTTNSDYGDITPPDPEEREENNEKARRQRTSSWATGRSMDLARTITRRETILSRIRTRPPIGPFSHPLESRKTTVEDLVDFDGPGDPYRPLNWAMKKKVITTALYGFTTMSATWGSSAYSPGTRQVALQYHVGIQVSTLGTTLFLFGFGLGPLLWAPLSEVYGRKVRKQRHKLKVYRDSVEADDDPIVGMLECRPAANVCGRLFRLWDWCGQGHPEHYDPEILLRVSRVACDSILQSVRADCIPALLPMQPWSIVADYPFSRG